MGNVASVNQQRADLAKATNLQCGDAIVEEKTADLRISSRRVAFGGDVSGLGSYAPVRCQSNRTYFIFSQALLMLFLVVIFSTTLRFSTILSRVTFPYNFTRKVFDDLARTIAALWCE